MINCACSASLKGDPPSWIVYSVLVSFLLIKKQFQSGVVPDTSTAQPYSGKFQPTIKEHVMFVCGGGGGRICGLHDEGRVQISLLKYKILAIYQTSFFCLKIGYSRFCASILLITNVDHTYINIS